MSRLGWVPTGVHFPRVSGLNETLLAASSRQKSPFVQRCRWPLRYFTISSLRRRAAGLLVGFLLRLPSRDCGRQQMRAWWVFRVSLGWTIPNTLTIQKRTQQKRGAPTSSVASS
ncbi:uncharacterized protein HMPREF1120_07868 [Exophiala dermatitidis NIH/UT8656]|uniref:Uncharacterized protein n=1 Tax=Exophiala dermatitidis (strain ATCC 34100 / CBS 525.76 / NIH/UT8656) TaxID=858893 RepID=H6C9I1_EXODN|nr:uncharacterized protein HMPREF1120_07868 [Exophiala dermatitidis NIH/UT8656]EHY59890.1 hypothetical protein HMPREF1120_07868 [Exophiala dermatitidis NIH/UT8656]